MPTVKPTADSRTHTFAPALLWLCLLGTACALLLATRNARAAAQTPVAPTRSIVVLVDESNSVRERDTENKRVRFTRFLVQYLQAFPETEGVDVSVIGFLAMTSTVAGPMPAWQWSRADLAGLERGLDTVPRKGNTLFTPALDAAQQVLGTSCLEDGRGACQIVLFSDGHLESESERAVSESVQALSSVGISVTMVLFPGDASEVDRARDVWAEVTLAVTNAADLPAQRVYSALLGALNLDEPLSQLMTMTLTQTANINQPIPAWQRNTGLTVLPDNPITERWDPPPDLQSGVQRWWLDPPEGQVSGTLQVAWGQTETLVYYSWQGESYPLSLEANVVPDRVILGQPVTLDAWFTAGGQVITASQALSVEAWLDGAPVPLSRRDDGHMSTVISTTVTGTHSVEFRPSLTAVWGERRVTPAFRFFNAEALPTLTLQVAAPLRLTQATLPLTITVVVSNTADVRGILTPTLWLAEPPITLTMASSGLGRFYTTTQVPSGTSIFVSASLPAGQTLRGLPFAGQEQSHRVTVPLPPEPEKDENRSLLDCIGSYPVLFVLGVLAVVLLMLALVAIRYLWSRIQRMKVDKDVREAIHILEILQSGGVLSNSTPYIRKLNKIMDDLGKLDTHRKETVNLIHQLGRIASLAYRSQAKRRQQPRSTYGS